MIVRMLTFAGGLAGAAGLTQFPEYSQQYIQRLGGAVDELTLVVENFDTSAAEAGLTREQALDDLQGSEFRAKRRDDMSDTITRQERLSEDLNVLRDAGPYDRLAKLLRFNDIEIAQKAMEDFKPAVPLTTEGAGFAAIGFFAGFGILWAFFGFCGHVFGRKKKHAETAVANPVDGQDDDTSDDPAGTPAQHQVNWSALPVPTDDGGADHLPKSTIPRLRLMGTDGNAHKLRRLRGRTVLYFYPMTAQPGVALPDDWDSIPGARGCTPQSCAFRDHMEDLRLMGVDQVFGISTQSPAYQSEAAERLHLPFPLLSDEELHLAEAWNLPTFEVAGRTLFKRLTLIMQDSVVEKVFYPVFPPDENPAEVIEYLESVQGDQTSDMIRGTG